jgi:hypothetical protein
VRFQRITEAKRSSREGCIETTVMPPAPHTVTPLPMQEATTQSGSRIMELRVLWVTTLQCSTV